MLQQSQAATSSGYFTADSVEKKNPKSLFEKCCARCSIFAAATEAICTETFEPVTCLRLARTCHRFCDV